MTPTEALSRLASAGRIRSAWLPRMRILLRGRRGHNEGTVVAAWSDDAGTLVVRWDTGHNETPIADIAPLWGMGDDPKIRAIATNPVSIEPDPSDPATTGCLLALLREAVGSPYLSPVWNAYLGRRYDPSDPGPDDFDNPPGDVSLDNARQWRIELCGAPDEVYDRLGTDLLGEGATDYDAVVAALDFVAGRLA